MIKLFTRTVDATELCNSRLFNNETFYRVFTKDIQSAKRRIYIESPYITTRRMDELMPLFDRAKRRGIHVTINTRCPDEHEGVYIEQARDAIATLQALDITVLYTVKLHRKLAVIDDLLWEGSLNILSQHDSCEIMRRIDSDKLVADMLEFIHISQYLK